MDELLVRLLFECTGCMINPLHSGVSCMDCCGIWGATHPGFVVTTRGVDGTRPLCREKWICNTSQTHCQIHVLLSSEKCFSLNMCELLRWCKSSLLHFLKCVHNMYMRDMEDRTWFFWLVVTYLTGTVERRQRIVFMVEKYILYIYISAFSF